MPNHHWRLHGFASSPTAFFPPLPFSVFISSMNPLMKVGAVPKLMAFALLFIAFFDLSSTHTFGDSGEILERVPGHWTEFSVWSTCNRACGGGLQFRARRCSNRTHPHHRSSSKTPSYCSGPYKQFRLCNTHSCPSGISSNIRAEECAKYDSRPFNSRRYKWLPKEGSEDRCQLVCKASGYEFHARLANRVPDGTKCGSNSTPSHGPSSGNGAVCIRGECRAVGCDGIVDSGRTRDACGICGGRGKTCQTFSGIFMRTEVLNDLLHVVTIPSGSSNLNVTDLKPTVNYYVVQDSLGHVVIDGSRQRDFSQDYHAFGTTMTYHRPGSSRSQALLLNGRLTEPLNLLIYSSEENPGIIYQYLRSTDSHPAGPNVVKAVKPANSNLIQGAFSDKTVFEYQHGRATEYYYPVQQQQQQRAPKTPRQHPRPYTGQQGAPPGPQHQPPQPYARYLPHQQQQQGQPNPYMPQGFPQGYPPQRSPNSPQQGPPQPYGPAPNPYGPPPPPPGGPPQGYSPAGFNRALPPQKYPGSVINRPEDPEELEEYVWRKSGFTECSRSCAGGVQESIILCIQRKTKAQVTDGNCNKKTKPQRDVAPCKTQPCDKPEWFVKTNWSDCSSTCGQGRQTRVVECVHRIGPTPKEFVYVSASLCDSVKKPPSVQNCRRRGCGVWSLGPWQECSSRCGRGFKSRDVRCVDQSNRLLPDSECDGPRPRGKDTCQGDSASCWFFTKWSDYCSSDCGQGVYTRKVRCLSATDMSPGECDNSDRPKEYAPCGTEGTQTCGGKWFSGPWSKCTSSCSGMRHREVVCMKQYQNTWVAVTDQYCVDGEKPRGVEKCASSKCEAEWYTTKWSKCSVSCGAGYQTREVRCLDTKSGESSEICHGDERPDDRRVCEAPKCPAKETAIVCEDRFNNCYILAKNPKLCEYAYYKDSCCNTCASAAAYAAAQSRSDNFQQQRSNELQSTSAEDTSE